MKWNSLLIVVLFFFLVACEEEMVEDPCAHQIPGSAQFETYEIIQDTFFPADTIYNRHFVRFGALQEHESYKWTVGDDDRAFDSRSFQLRFGDSPGTYDVTLEAESLPNIECFPDDSGSYVAQKKLTIVPYFKPGQKLSPMIGDYVIAPIGAPQDTFTIQLLYLDSLKYDPTKTGGSKYFYWFNNFPDGYVDSTSTRSKWYPELRNGNSVNMGYKSFVSQDVPNGTAYASLHDTDSITLNYKSAVLPSVTYKGIRKN